MRLIKQKISFLLVLALLVNLLLPGMGAFAAETTNDSVVSGDIEKILTNSVSDLIKESLQEKLKDFKWKITKINTSVNIKELTESQFEAEVYVNLKHTLAVSQPEDLPVLKGKLKFLKEKGGDLSKKELDTLNLDIETWRNTLKQYISDTQNASINLIVKGQIKQDGALDTKNVDIYALDPFDNPIPLNEYLSTPQDSDIENDAYTSIDSLANSTKVEPMDTGTPKYSHSSATYYIKKYTSNTTKPCTTGSSTVQDSSKYNTAYNWYQCNDCANYVSQALAYGGIPTNSIWKPYTTTWIRAYDLESYMLNYYFMVSASTSTCMPGDPIVWHSGDGHIAMCSYNQGGVLKYSAHSSDRLDYIYGSGAKLYRVIY